MKERPATRQQGRGSRQQGKRSLKHSMPCTLHIKRRGPYHCQVGERAVPAFGHGLHSVVSREALTVALVIVRRPVHFEPLHVLCRFARDVAVVVVGTPVVHPLSCSDSMQTKSLRCSKWQSAYSSFQRVTSVKPLYSIMIATLERSNDQHSCTNFSDACYMRVAMFAMHLAFSSRISGYTLRQAALPKGFFSSSSLTRRTNGLCSVCCAKMVLVPKQLHSQQRKDEEKEQQEE